MSDILIVIVGIALGYSLRLVVEAYQDIRRTDQRLAQLEEQRDQEIRDIEEWLK